MKTHRVAEKDVEYSSGRFPHGTRSLVDDFLTSMPERYRQEFDKSSARQHARVVMERNHRPIYADRFQGNGVSGPGLCVAAVDAPGLLALISTGLLLEGFDIVRADAYTRRNAFGEYEAVDLFWLRRSTEDTPLALSEDDITAIRATLLELIRSGRASTRVDHPAVGLSPGDSETRVRFRDVRGVPWLTLELEANDRPGLLSVVSAALTAEGLQIIESRIRTYGLRVHDYFDVLENNGTRPSGTRLQRIQLAVFTAIDGNF